MFNSITNCNADHYFSTRLDSLILSFISCTSLLLITTVNTLIEISNEIADYFSRNLENNPQEVNHIEFIQIEEDKFISKMDDQNKS
ncbi:hypothetical protein BCR32DRAFT_280656 [Anaeromyces robustus]|uniref:Uncharacterized protein n=1 Tax=Anaeromyces robustus TaxID=1754192 RepID=A0A1Y1X3F7_9FUNG|nr:hypothetical protein BCR32DRAFT_280656 [Anaeromyces robustus]|eukprot:ORX80313.1 hypothetical protein BCR32DRAFT_280656 [Anaeromyces robustus]